MFDIDRDVPRLTLLNPRRSGVWRRKLGGEKLSGRPLDASAIRRQKRGQGLVSLDRLQQFEG